MIIIMITLTMITQMDERLYHMKDSDNYDYNNHPGLQSLTTILSSRFGNQSNWHFDLFGSVTGLQYKSSYLVVSDPLIRRHRLDLHRFINSARVRLN